MLEIVDNIGYMKLMDGTSLLAHKKSTEQKIEDNKKAGHVFSNEESEMSEGCYVGSVSRLLGYHRGGADKE